MPKKLSRIMLPDSENLVLTDLANRAGKDESQYLAELIREAAWRELAKEHESPQQGQQFKLMPSGPAGVKLELFKERMPIADKIARTDWVGPGPNINTSTLGYSRLSGTSTFISSSQRAFQDG